MLIDCNRCAVRGAACPDCVVTVFLALPRTHAGLGPRPGRAAGPGPAAGSLAATGAGPGRFVLDDSERDAVAALAAAGLVPPLRLVAGMTADVPNTA